MQTNAGYVVRRAVASDADAIAALSLVAQEVHREAAPDRVKPGDIAALAALFAEELAAPDSVILLAETGEQVVGYVYAKVTAQSETAFSYAHTTLHVHQLAVSPSHRRGGAATGLMRGIEDEASVRRINEATLVYWNFNSAAANLFQSLGYSQQSHRMRKTLQGGS